jgi:hypothetical protein
MAQLLLIETIEEISAEDRIGGPYRFCPFGSGKKLCSCHGNRATQLPFSGVSSAKTAPLDAQINGTHAERASQSLPHGAYGATK